MRNLLVDALMGSRPVEIRDVETQDTMELLLTEDQYVIQALPPNTPPESVHKSHWGVSRDTAFSVSSYCSLLPLERNRVQTCCHDHE